MYEIQKSHTDIGQSYNTFKYTVHADRIYTRLEHQLQGRMFLIFIAIMMHYRIYIMLKKIDLLSRYSPEDAIRHLDRIYMLRIGYQWKLLETHM